MKWFLIIVFHELEGWWRTHLAFWCGDSEYFLNQLIYSQKTIDKVIYAACSLHNWLRKTTPNSYIPPQAVDQEDFNNGNIITGEWREHVNNLKAVNRMGSNNYKRDAEDVRSSLAKYFIKEFDLWGSKPLKEEKPWSMEHRLISNTKNDEKVIDNLKTYNKEFFQRFLQFPLEKIKIISKFRMKYKKIK